jgi:threonine aldolase
MTTPIDLRSDTVTKPSQQMREAMAQADVDDDVIDIDPTVARLQNKIAELTGKEAALFVPSGTMSNQIGLRIHCRSGDEFICESQCHIYSYEQGAYASLSGLAVQLLPGNDGVLDPAQFIGTIKSDNEHFCRTKLVCLENTHNRGGGRILPYDGVAEICKWAHDNGLATHLDGARLFNAVAASGIPAAQWAQHFDTVSICFSKGLGAPVGSALCGTTEMIAFARRHRKMFGGGMRQAGIIAAGALFALEHNLEQLHIDNQNAQQLAQTIRDTEGLQLAGDRADTNIVMFDVSSRVGSPSALVAELESQNVRCLALGPTRVRMVTHLDVSNTQINQACEILNQIVTNALTNDRKLTGSGAQY